MKGLVFNELLDFIERRDGLACVDSVLTAAHAEGVYVGVGAYDHGEFHRLIDGWSEFTGRPRKELLIAFGEHMCATLVARFPAFSEQCTDAFDLLTRLDGEIHVEVLKLFPDADLPSIQVTVLNPRTLQLDYASHRNLADFAQGMIQGCINHFGEKISVCRRVPEDTSASTASFQLTRSD